MIGEKEKKVIINFFVLPMLIVFFIDELYYIFNFNTIYSANVKPIFISIIIINLLLSIFIGITKSTKKSYIIVLSFFGLFMIMNQFKIFYMEEPITFFDLKYLGDTSEIIGLIRITLIDAFLKHIWFIMLLISVFIIFFLISAKNDVKMEKKKYRVISILLPILIFFLLFLPIEFTNNILLSNIYNADSRNDFNRFTTNTSSVLQYGVIANLHENLLETRLWEPKDYDENELNEILNKKDDKLKQVNYETPNIIVLFSESFWDIEKQEEIKFDKEITYNFNNLKNQGKLIEVISPTYGGLSSNVEFELLTGANSAFFNKGYVPYMQLYTNDDYYNKESIIGNLKKNGYYTKLLTANSEKLYNCGKVYNYMGIDETEYLDSIQKPDYAGGNYIKDEFIIDKIIEEFNNKEKNQKLFYFAETLQSHMPYYLEKYENYDIKITESKFDEDINDTMLSYAQGIYDADQQLNRLYDYIQSLDENTIIIFLGDHLPHLRTKGNQLVMSKLSYFNTGDINLNMYRKYNTEALILSNYDITNFDDVKYLGDDLLLTYIINNIGIDISDYYKWLYKNKDIMPSFNHYVSNDSEGNIYTQDTLTDKMNEFYLLREKMQYKLWVK